MKTLSNEELTRKLSGVASTQDIHRGRIDKNLKLVKKAGKKLNLALDSEGGIEPDLLRRIQLMEKEIDATANTINYFMDKLSGKREKGDDTDKDEDKDGDKDEDKDDDDDDDKDNCMNKAKEVAGFDFTDTLIPEKVQN